MEDRCLTWGSPKRVYNFRSQEAPWGRVTLQSDERSDSWDDPVISLFISLAEEQEFECQRILLCLFSSFIFSSFSVLCLPLPSFFPSLPYFCSFMNSYIVWEHISTNILHEEPLHVSIWKFHYCQGNLLFSEQQYTAMMNGTDERGLPYISHSSLSKNSICVAVFVQSLNSV